MKTFAMFAVVTACAAAGAAAADSFHKTLISARDGVRVDTEIINGADVTPGAPAWSVRKVTLHGGKQEGVDAVLVNNGKLQFTVIPTRGMGVLSVTCGDVTLGWESPVKEVVHPSYMNLQSRGGLGWLEGFNEWLTRCGLESNGHPGTDRFINNVGDEATMELTLHGKIGNIPASEVELTVDAAPPHRIRLRGRVDERMFYGPKLELQTEISTEPGSASFRVTDVITNRGADSQEFEILYHCNYGRPLLEEGASFLAPIERITPFNEHAAKEIDKFAVYNAPKLGFVEQVYCIVPLADKAGRSVIALCNKAKDRAVSMEFQKAQLPYVSLWKNTNAVGEGYVTGLEPGTNFPNNRRIERKYGRVPKLLPGASHQAEIDVTIHSTAEETQAVAARIASIQGAAKPTVDRAPEKKD